MARLRLKLLGSYRLTLDDVPIEAIVSDKARALLAYLAVECDHHHPREKLVGLFWPEQNEEHARGSLSQALYHLRGALGDRPLTGEMLSKDRAQIYEPYLLVTPQEIHLNPHSDFETDVAAFLALVAACKAHAHPIHEICIECLKRYQEAANLYAGDFLDGFYLPKSVAFEEWATILREQLRLEVMAVLEHLVVAFERRGELDQSLDYARKMVQLDELGEAGNQNLMRLLALMDRRGEALAQYASFQQALAVQMGAEPGMETKILYQRLQNEAAGTSLGYLPSSLTPLVGRRQELDELWGMIRVPKSRLICVLGPGGSGKTRLALEAAQRQRYYFRDGVYFVPLSALAAGSSLLAVIAEGMGFTFRESGDPKTQLLDYLRNKKMLLILDSFETVVESAGMVAELLSASEGSKAVVTSRARLNLSGEHVFPLEGMRVPPSGAKDEMLNYSSVELFVQAARRVKPGYAPENVEDVAHICRLVDGMPLSILLASTWVTEYSLQYIANQISLSLDFLSVEWADLPERQRSLRATFEYSWNMLSAREQEALIRLSVFRNPFSMEAAQNIAGARPQMLHGLVGKSLLGSPSEGYYQMHDLVHQYIWGKLSQAPNGQEHTIRQQHSDYFLERAAGWSKVLKGPMQTSLLLQVDKEIDDVKAAWEWAAGQADLEQLWLASEGLFLCFFLRYRFQEGEQACQVVLKAVHGAPEREEWLNLEGWLLAWQIHFNRLLGKVELARQLAEKCIETLNQADAAGQNTQRGQALFWRERGYLTSKLSEQIDCFQHSAELFQAWGDIWWQGVVLAWTGEVANRMGDRVLALKLHQQAVALSRTAGEPRQLARSLMNLAYDHLIHWKWETGAQLMEEAAGWFRSVGDLGSEATGELHLGVSFGWTGRLHEACDMLEDALVKLHQLGDRFYITYGTVALGVIHMYSGRYQRADLILQEALYTSRDNGFRREEAHSQSQLGCLALVQGKPEQALAGLQQSSADLRLMGFAGELAITVSGMALAQHLLGQDELAWDSLGESLRLAVETHSRFTLFTLPAALIMILADSGRWEQALEAYSAVMTDPLVTSSRWFADMVGNRMDLAREHLSEDVRLAAEARGREGDVFDMLGRLAQELSSWGTSQPTPSLN